MIDDLLTLLWRCLTGFSNDEIELLDDGYFLVVDNLEWDALGDTVEDAEAELRRIATSESFEMEWDHRFRRGTALLATVESLADAW